METLTPKKRGRKPIPEEEKIRRQKERIEQQKLQVKEIQKQLLSPQNVLSRRLKEWGFTPKDLVELSENRLYESDIRAICAGNQIVDRELGNILDDVFGDVPGTWSKFQTKQDLFMFSRLTEEV